MRMSRLRNILKYISLALFLVAMAALCAEALMPGKQSSEQSSAVGEIVDKALTPSSGAQPLSARVGNWNLLIRKLFGHFGAFFLLGCLAGLTCALFDRGSKKQRILTLTLLAAYGFLFAGLTELLQLDLFTSGRGCSFRDVLIDFSGYLPAFLLTYGGYLIVCILKERAKNKRQGGNHE